MLPSASANEKEFMVLASSSVITNCAWGCNPKDFNDNSLIFFPIEATTPSFKKLVPKREFSLLAKILSNFAIPLSGTM